MAALKFGLVAFWAAWFAIVVLTNGLGLMRATGWLPPAWPFASRNDEAVVRATARYRPPRWVPLALFAAAVAWQLAVAVLFALALVASAPGTLHMPAVDAAFAGGILLWAAFMLADELTLEYAFERAHELLFLSQLASLGAIHLLPD